MARLIQGLAHGGELPSSQTYLSEMAPKERRGFWATLIYTSGTVGILFGTLLGAVLNMTLSAETHERVGLAHPVPDRRGHGPLRADHAVPPARDGGLRGEAAAEKRAPIWPQIVRHRKQALQVIGLTVGLTVVYYIWGVVAPSLRHHRPEDRPRARPCGPA